MSSLDDAYGTLAGVYEYLLPESVLTPEANVASYAQAAATFEPGARVLDCAAGIGLLAVGLALRGFDVVATDASPAMIARTIALAAAHGVDIPAITCPWEDLGRQGWVERFDAVFCVGNSLAHAPGRAARRSALAEMRSVLRHGGLLVVDSRNWELVRALGSRIDVGDRLRERGSERALPIHPWTVTSGWEEPLCLDAVIAVIGEDGAVTDRRDRLSFRPFSHQMLKEDLQTAGFAPTATTYAENTDFYTVTARRVSVAGG
jgi:SAM-dependent methyltransferase